VVPVAVRDRHPDSSGVVLTALRSASERLDATEGAAVDQLFVLEATIRAGRAAAPLRQRLSRVQRDSAWRVSESWEADVPHAVELAQLVCVVAAEGNDIPQAWCTRLAETCAQLARRTSRFNATTDPVILATLIRGLAAIGQAVPPDFIDSAEAMLDEPAPSQGLYELCDALNRHREHRPLAERVAQRAFSAASGTTGDAVARWWLADRWQSVSGQPLSVAPEALDTARRQSLAGNPGGDVRAMAMTIEVMGRASENLVIETTQEMAARLSRQERAREAEVIIWRFGTAAAILIGLVVNASRLLIWILGGTPDRALLQATAGVLGAAAGWVILRGLLRLGMLAGRRLGDLERAVDILVPLAVGVLGAFIYR